MYKEENTPGKHEHHSKSDTNPFVFFIHHAFRGGVEDALEQVRWSDRSVFGKIVCSPILLIRYLQSLCIAGLLSSLMVMRKLYLWTLKDPDSEDDFDTWISKQ